MISSDLHGAEEPIRWLLGWQRQDNVEMSPCMKKKKDVLTQDTLAEPDLGGSPTADEMMAFDGQDATQGRLDVFWSMWQCAGTYLAHVAGCRSPRRANVLLLGC
jgi:hypothetical protein